MKFEVRSAGAGSAGAILQNEGVRRVYSAFGDCCQRVYRFDIRTKPTYMNAQTLRQVQSFVRDYGVEDAEAIVNAFFGVGHEGMLRGKPLGKSIFSKSFRWLSDQLLIEVERDRSFGASPEPVMFEEGEDGTAGLKLFAR